jgi:heme/copper-type cytochrome/quinol oxidase subunit 4
VSRINPTLRGLAIIVLIAVVITVLNLQNSVISLLLIARIAFFLAIAFFLFLLWRDRREEISMWGTRSRVVFYGAVVLAVANVGIWILTEYPEGGLQTLGAVGVLVACGYSLWRIWRQEHTYTY